MELVTGFKGEAHISAENWADLNRGLAGDGSYVLPVGEKFRAELVTNNLLKIYDGCGIFQGRQVVIPAGQSDEITIENGSQGEKRIDIVGVRYVKDESSKIETTESVYVKGTPAESDPVAPNLEEGNIRAGDLVANWALYQVELDGLNVVSVTPLFETLRSGAEVAEELEALNSKLQGLLADPEDIDLTLNTSSFMSNNTWAQRVGKQVTVYPQVVGVPVKGRTIATGLPAPTKQIIARDATFGQIALSTSGILSIISAGTTSSTYLYLPFSYWTK